MSYRIVTIVVIALAALATPPAATAPAHADMGQSRSPDQARLVSTSRDRVTVTDNKIRLGDLFTNTGGKADIVVEAAPAAGSQAVFDVHQLAAVAQYHGLVWQARSWSEKVVIERASQVVPADRVMSVLRAAVEREMGAEGRFEIEIPGRDLSIALPADAPGTVTVENLRVQRTSGQFTAVIATPAGSSAPKISVAGRLFRVIEAPTLNRRISTGDVIGKDDINWVTLRADRVSRNVITDPNHIVGMTPTRTLVAGKVLMTGEVRPPRIVTKGSLVIMLLRTPHMVLTSRGRAMEHGAKGDVIKVRNTQSKTIVEGEVTASGTIEVSVAAFPRLGAAQVAGTAATARR